MPRQLVPVLLLAFLASIGVNWPALPFNASVADCVFVLLALAVVSMPRPALTWRRADLAIVIYLLGSIPAILISTDLRRSLIEFVRELYVVAIYVVTVIAVRHGLARTVARGLALCGGVLSAAGIAFVALQWLGGPPWYPMGEVMQLPYIGDTLRLRALTASESMFACVLTGCIPFAIALCTSEKDRRWCAAAAGGLVAAAFTVSHSIAGFSVAVLIAAWPSLAAWPRLRRLAMAGVVVVIIGLNFAATISIRSVSSGEARYADASNYFHAVDRGVAHVGGTTITYDVMSYFRIKQVALRAFADHPIAGIGLDRFHTATTAAFHDGRLPQFYSEIDPHSTFIGRLAETGIIGGVTLVWLWITWIGMARDSAARGNAVGLAAAAAFAGLLVNTTNVDVMNFRFLWVIAGLMRGLQDSPPNASTPLNDQGHAPR